MLLNAVAHVTHDNKRFTFNNLYECRFVNYLHVSGGAVENTERNNVSCPLDLMNNCLS